MKSLVYLVLEAGPQALHVLEEIKGDGYNATIMSTESLRHALDELDEERHFFTLRHYENAKNTSSMFCLFVVDNDKLTHLKDVIRKNTNEFNDIKGFMFSRKIEDYEGSI